MMIGHQIPGSCEFFERCALPGCGVAVDEIDDGRVKHEKAAVDQGLISRGLFDEPLHLIFVDLQCAIAPRRCDGGYCGAAAMAFVKCHQLANVDIRQAVAVSETKWLIGGQIAGNAAQAPARHRGLASVDKRNLPSFCRGIVIGGFVVTNIERDVRIVQKEVGKIFLDHIAAIAEANYELVDAMLGINLHYVPQNRAVANFNHRLWPEVGFL